MWSKIRSVLIGFVVIIGSIAAGFMSFFLFNKFNKEEEKNDMGKTISIESKPEKTEVLPKSEELDKTLEEIEKDILQ